MVQMVLHIQQTNNQSHHQQRTLEKAKPKKPDSFKEILAKALAFPTKQTPGRI